MTVLVRFRHVLAPIAGVVFIVLWLIAEAGRSHPWSFSLVVIAYGAAIAASARLPLASLITIAAIPLGMAAGLLPLFQSTTWPIAFATMIVGFTVALTANSFLKWLALGIGLGQAVLVAFLITVPTWYPHMWESWIGVSEGFRNPWRAFLLAAIAAAALYGLAWTVGFAAHLNLRRLNAWLLMREADAELREATAELDIAVERNAIAQEVHDVVAHSLSVAIMVADGARYLRPSDPSVTDDAFREIADAARAALIDVRGLIEALREPSEQNPRPGIADLEPIYRRVRSAGPEVTVVHLGDPRPLTPARDLAVHRIVQESLTNALRHQGATVRIRVQFDWAGTGLLLTVVSRDEQGEPDATHPPLVAGTGLRGMTDRARLAGGWLTAAWDDHDAFLVTAFIPAAAAAAEGANTADEGPEAVAARP